MKLPQSWALTLIISFIVLLWMLSGIFSSDEKPTEISSESKITKKLSVRVSLSEAETMTNRLILQGHTLAKRKVTIKAETSGLVSDVFVKRGENVTTNHTLMRLAIDNRQAQIKQAMSLLKQQQALHTAALSLKQEGFQAEIEIAKANAALESAKAAVNRAKLELDRITIKAPIPGIVNTRMVEIGDYVSPGDPLAILIDLDPIRIVAQVSERYLGQIQIGKTGEVRLLDNSIVNAKVSYVGAIASGTTRTFPVEMEISNPQNQIIEGITAELHLPIKQILAHNVSPSTLSLLDNGALSVKAVNEQNKVVAYPIQILGETQTGIWLGGLPQKITLITVGHEFVKPGENVIAVDVSAKE